jgi:hypothetical protein
MHAGRVVLVGGIASRHTRSTLVFRAKCYSSQMHVLRMRWGAHFLLMAALTMVLETSCSHQPQRPTTPEMKAAIDATAGKNVVLRFHTTEGTTYATSQYAVTDSFVVINEILRDPKYYQAKEARLYGKSNLRPPSREVILPVKLPISEIYAMDKWEPRSVEKDMVSGGLIVAGLLVAAFAFMAYLLAKGLEGLGGN